MEDLPARIDSLEEEDLLYLNYYLDREYNASPDFDDLPSSWSPLSGKIDDCSPEPSTADEPIGIDNFGEYVERTSSDHLQSNGNKEDVPQDARPVRKNKGVPKDRFVSFESFPPVRGKPYVCKLCGMKLATKESNRRHVLSKHVKDRCHVCNVCGKALIFKFALKAHSAIHLDTPKFVCVCGMSFKLRASYMNHIQRIHRAASETKYSCELCFKSFGDRHTLRIHMTSVHKPKVVPCAQKGCSKIFSSVSLMRCHYRYHLNKKFTCDKCGQSFSTESYLQKHSLSHSGVRPYACIDCGKTYMSASHRNQHRRICHSSVREYQCSFCGKCFKRKDLLTYHENNHRGEKPFKCEVCGYATSYKNTYYAHRKKHLMNWTPDASKKSVSNAAKSSKGALKRGVSAETKSKKRKAHPLTKPKVKAGKHSSASRSVKRKKKSPSVCSSSVDFVSPTSSCTSSSSISFSSSSSASSLTKHANVDIIIFPQSVPSCSREQVNEPVLDNNADLSVKCADPVSNLIVYSKEDSNSNDQNIKDDINLVSKEYLNRQASLSREKNECSVILSNNGRCSISECKSVDDSLLLVKIGENSFAGVCAYHTVSDDTEMSELNLNSVENLTLTTVDSKCVGTSSVTGRNALVIRSPANSFNHVERRETVPNDQKLLIGSPSKRTESLLDLSSIDQSTSLLSECDQNPIVDAISLPLTQSEGLKSSSEVYHSDNITSDADIDSGLPRLSSSIVDDSFHLAQLEVICPLCDEQFFCMDTYITHLECIHN